MDWPYSKKFIKEFIEIYETLPSLWDPNDPDFTNRDARECDYSALVLKLAEVEPKVDKALVQSKLNALRRQYRNEWRKAKEQNRPMRKFFDCLRFLPEPTPLMQRNAVETPEPGPTKTYGDPLDDDESEEANFTVSTVSSIEKDESNGSQNWNDGDNMEVHEVTTDQFDHITKVWTESLQNLPRDQQIYAERIINNILFEAQVGNLTTNSPIQVSQYLHTNW